MYSDQSEGIKKLKWCHSSVNDVRIQVRGKQQVCEAKCLSSLHRNNALFLYEQGSDSRWQFTRRVMWHLMAASTQSFALSEG